MVWYLDRKKQIAYPVLSLRRVDNDNDEITILHNGAEITRIVSVYDLHIFKPGNEEDLLTHNKDFHKTHQHGCLLFASDTGIEKEYKLDPPHLNAKEVYEFVPELPHWPYCVHREGIGFQDIEPILWTLDEERGSYTFFAEENIEWDARVFIDDRQLPGGLVENFDCWSDYTEYEAGSLCGTICEDKQFIIRKSTIARVEVYDTQATFNTREEWFDFLKQELDFDGDYIFFVLSHFLNPIFAQKIIEFQPQF